MVATFNEHQHPRDKTGKFEKVTAAPSVDVIDDATTSAASTFATPDVPSVYRFGAPDFVDTCDLNTDPHLTTNPTGRSVLRWADQHNGEHAHVEALNPQTGETLRCHGRATRDNNDNLVIYGESPDSPGRNDHFAIPADHVTALHQDPIDVAVGAPDDDPDMDVTDSATHPFFAHDVDSGTVHVRDQHGAVVSYANIPADVAEHAATDPTILHGRYPVAGVFAPEGRRIDIGGDRTVTYRLGSEELVTTTPTQSTCTAVPPAMFAQAFARKHPQVALERLVQKGHL